MKRLTACSQSSRVLSNSGMLVHFRRCTPNSLPTIKPILRVKHPLLSDVEALDEISDTPKVIFGRPTLEFSYLILVLRDLDSLSGRLLLVFPPLHEHWDECDEFSEDNDRG